MLFLSCFLPLFLCLCNCPDGLLIVVYYTGLAPLQTLGVCPKLADTCSDVLWVIPRFTNRIGRHIIELYKGGGGYVSKRKSTQTILVLVYHLYPLSFFWIILYLYKFWRHLRYDFSFTFYLCFPATLRLCNSWFVYLGLYEPGNG